MESSSSSNELAAAAAAHSCSFWDYLLLFFFRPLFALFFVLFVLLLGWWLAWKLVLVHVPLVQEIFGLRKKPSKAPPPQRRFTKIYFSIDATSKRR